MKINLYKKGSGFMKKWIVSMCFFLLLSGCIKNNECAFANDHSEPQMVMKTARQGGMIMQTQVKNPNLIKKHCLNCDCAYIMDGEPLCLKDSPEFSCQNWKLQKTLLQQHYQ